MRPVVAIAAILIGLCVLRATIHLAAKIILLAILVVIAVSLFA